MTIIPWMGSQNNKSLLNDFNRLFATDTKGWGNLNTI